MFTVTNHRSSKHNKSTGHSGFANGNASHLVASLHLTPGQTLRYVTSDNRQIKFVFYNSFDILVDTWSVHEYNECKKDSLRWPPGEYVRIWICDDEVPCLPGEVMALRGNSWLWLDFYTHNLGLISISHKMIVTSQAEIKFQIHWETVRVAGRLGSVRNRYSEYATKLGHSRFPGVATQKPGCIFRQESQSTDFHLVVILH